MNFVLESPGSSEIRRGPGTFPAETPATAKPKHHLSPSFPRNPLSPPSAPVQRRLQAPHAKSKFLAVGRNDTGGSPIYDNIILATTSDEVGLTAIPEPATSLLGALSLIGLLRRRRS